MRLLSDAVHVDRIQSDAKRMHLKGEFSSHRVAESVLEFLSDLAVALELCALASSIP